jgi:putative PIN family toxin of toxin-antitoxin system
VLNVTADTNVLISALVYRRGKPYQLLQMATAGDINLTVSEDIVAEMAEVLVRKFKASEQEVAEAIAIVRDAARIVRPSVTLDVVKDDPDDNRIVECAVSAGSDFIVTGDKDLLRMGRYDSIRILNVSDFLAVALGEGQGR